MAASTHRPVARSLLLLLAAGLSTGVQWDLAQIGAWVRMTAVYAEAMPVGRAMQLALDPDNACGLCRVVAGARDSEEQAPPLLIERQVDKQVCDSQVVVARGPVPRGLAPPAALAGRLLRPGDAPPVPPPRLG